MKKFIVLIAFIAFAITIKAQQPFTVTHSETLTDADTISYVIDHNDLRKADYYISSHIQADSVSGATAATAYIQFSNQATGDYWYSADTVTIDGVQTIDYNEDILTARRMRLYVLSTGTQSTTFVWGLHAVPREQ